MTAAIIAALIQAAAIGGSAYYTNKYGTKTSDVKGPEYKRELIDKLLMGLQGSGPYASLFSASPEAFERGVVNPLMKNFQNQVAPGIQQKFISSGQYRGTPM